MSVKKEHSKGLEEKVKRLKQANRELREHLKAKDEAFNILAETVYMKAIREKDEEIERLKVDKGCAKSVIDWHEKECEMYIKLHHQKARSIVAMLFWEMRKALRISNSSDVPNNHGKTTQSFYLFKKAYAILKDKQ